MSSINMLTKVTLVLLCILTFSSCRKNIPITIAIESGNLQIAPINAVLSDPVVIKVTNHKGKPIEGIEVTFLIESGSGSFVDGDYSYIDSTDADGLAQAKWRLGDENFTQRIKVHVKYYNGAPLEFYASPEFYRDVRDGQTYLLAQMGTQVWMAQNMRLNTPASDANPNYPNTAYGRLYPWSDLATLCPSGYHVPSSEEWNNLINATKNATNSLGQSLKSTTGWYIGGNGKNFTGFNIYPSGSYITDNSLNEFRGYREYAAFWTSDELLASNEAYYRTIDQDGAEIATATYNKNNLTACRCVRN